MAKTRYVYGVAPDGSVLKRRTPHEYRYGVVAKKRDGTYEMYSCSRTYQGAYKTASRYGGTVVEVSDQKPEV